jgi:hypothetical protein
MLDWLDELITQYGREHGLSKSDFNSSSVWFSYGSNLSETDFKDRMKGYDYELGHLNPIRARLDGWRRELANASKKHGLGYTIVECPTSPALTVEGLLHEIPLKALPAFLRKEGILNQICHVKCDSTRSYDIQRITASEPSQEALTLIGRCRKALDQVENEMLHKLEKYVEDSICGANFYNLNCSDMISDLECVRERSKTAQNDASTVKNGLLNP